MIVEKIYFSVSTRNFLHFTPTNPQAAAL